jgi:hypothetical protein
MKNEILAVRKNYVQLTAIYKDTKKELDMVKFALNAEKERIKMMEVILANSVPMLPPCHKSVQKSWFPNQKQRLVLACCKPFIRFFAPLEFIIKFEYDPSDFFAASKTITIRLLGSFLSFLGPKPEKTDFCIETARKFLNKNVDLRRKSETGRKE